MNGFGFTSDWILKWDEFVKLVVWHTQGEKNNHFSTLE